MNIMLIFNPPPPQRQRPEIHIPSFGSTTCPCWWVTLVGDKRRALLECCPRNPPQQQQHTHSIGFSASGLGFPENACFGLLSNKDSLDKEGKILSSVMTTISREGRCY